MDPLSQMGAVIYSVYGLLGGGGFKRNAMHLALACIENASCFHVGNTFPTPVLPAQCVWNRQWEYLMLFWGRCECQKKAETLKLSRKAVCYCRFPPPPPILFESRRRFQTKNPRVPWKSLTDAALGDEESPHVDRSQRPFQCLWQQGL